MEDENERTFMKQEKKEVLNSKALIIPVQKE